MKKWPAILLFIVALSAQTPLGQFFKLPFLIQHYFKHQKHDGLSLSHFLHEHYASHHDDADLPEDEQLPFKNFTLHIMASAVLTNTLFPVQDPVLAPEKEAIFSRVDIPKQMLSSIFHPPKA